MISEEAHSLTVVSASGSSRLMRSALEFVYPHEKYCCALFMRIINEDDSVYVIVEKGTEKSFNPAIFGVFTYNPGGRVVFSCLPHQNPEVERALFSFFSTRSIFCISGFEKFTNFLEGIHEKISPGMVREVHEYSFMHFNPSLCYSENGVKGDASILKTERLCSIFKENELKAAKDMLFREEASRTRQYGIYQCSVTDAEALFPLQLNYAREEVLPVWRNPVPSAERANLEQTLKHQFVFGIKSEEGFAAKANTNAITPNFFQIGGVYTMPKYRSRGLACALVHHLSVLALSEGKQAVLFVKKKNLPAIKAYTKAGYENFGNSKIVYFKEQ